MTRKKMSKYVGKNKRYNGKIRKINESTVLLVDVKIGNKKLADHCLVGVGDRFKFNCGDVVSFNAIVCKYTRKDGTQDYGLSRSHKFDNVDTPTLENMYQVR